MQDLVRACASAAASVRFNPGSQKPPRSNVVRQVAAALGTASRLSQVRAPYVPPLPLPLLLLVLLPLPPLPPLPPMMPAIPGHSG